ncbi:autotransporter domain-containing protein [Ochrobactrum vermis]|uniref:Autotransporter domain-containing protein n=1 Tax=Ochrobactrum vermis TaxID=1827297 RepID=A0ABU8PHS7_9HYPH|nr:autotransporter domain-containing protein [Ochrobactrum vermis]
MLSSAAALLFFSSAPAAYSQTTSTWTGNADNAWTNTGNWSGGISPGNNNRVSIETPVALNRQPHVEAGFAALANSIYLDQGNSLTVRDGGSLITTDLISIGGATNVPSSTSLLQVVSGGTVGTDRLFIGDGLNKGAVLVTGAGSTLSVNLSKPTGRFVVGAWGDGEIGVANRGVLSVGGAGLIELGNDYNGRSATGTLRIGDTGSAGTVSAQEIRFNTSTSQIIANFTDSSILSAEITGTGSVIKDGVGTLMLSGANTYSGITSINNGVLLAGAANTFSVNSGLGVFGLAVLDLNDYNQSIGSLAGSGTVSLGNATLTTGANNTSTTFSGRIQGTGKLIKSGTGTLTLTGSSNHTGGTVISGGTVSVNQGSAVIDALGTGLIALDGGRLHSALGGSTINSYLVAPGTTGTISTATGTELWLNGGSGQEFSLQGNLVIGASDGAGDVVMDAVGTPTAQDATITVAYGRLVDGNGSLGNLTSIAGATRVATGATIDFSGHGGTIRNLQDAAPGNGGTVSWSNDPLTVNGGSFSGQLDNPLGGELVKGSIDTLLLNSDNSAFRGTTTVADGKLIVGDINSSSALGGNISVLSGAILSGYGSVGNTIIQSGGILSPGNSIGTLTVDGNLTLAPGSALEIEIAGNGTSDRVDVTGTATVSGSNVSVTTIDPETSYQNGQLYHILTADSGISGEFAGVVSNSAFLDISVVNDDSAADLRICLKTDCPKPVDPETPGPGTSEPEPEKPSPPLFTTVAETDNQYATAAGLDTLGQTGSSLALYNTLLMLSADEARAAFDALSGEAYASAKGLLINDSQFVRNAALGRLQQAFGGAPATPINALSYVPSQKTASASASAIDAVAPASTAPAQPPYTAWGYAYGARTRQDGNGNAGDVKSSIGGFVTGIDATVLDTWRLGLLAGYSHSSFDVNDRASSGSSDNYTLGAYAGSEWTLNHGHALAFRSGLAYTWHNIDMDRSVAFPGFADNLTANYDAGSFQVFGELGYKMRYRAALFEPYAGLAYLRLKTGGFDEKGLTAAGLSVHSDTMDTGVSTLGFRASTEFALGSIIATARTDLGWRHAYGDITPVSTASFIGSDAFTVSGLPIGKDVALIEAGLDFKLTEDATLGLSYTGQFASGARQNGLNAKLSVNF